MGMARPLSSAGLAVLRLSCSPPRPPSPSVGDDRGRRPADASLRRATTQKAPGLEDFTISNPGFNPSDPDDPANEWQITLNAYLDPDPQIIYAMSVIDFGAPSVFGFIFAQTIAATPAPGVVLHSESSSTTDRRRQTARRSRRSRPRAGFRSTAM